MYNFNNPNDYLIYNNFNNGLQNYQYLLFNRTEGTGISNYWYDFSYLDWPPHKEDGMVQVVQGSDFDKILLLTNSVENLSNTPTDTELNNAISLYCQSIRNVTNYSNYIHTPLISINQGDNLNIICNFQALPEEYHNFDSLFNNSTIVKTNWRPTIYLFFYDSNFKYLGGNNLKYSGTQLLYNKQVDIENCKYISLKIQYRPLSNIETIFQNMQNKEKILIPYEVSNIQINCQEA